MLRDYQQDCLTACLAQPKGGLCVLPTGSGKSHIIAELCHQLEGQNILVLTPRVELMRQNKEKIKNNTPCVTINAAYGRGMTADILIIDECHLIKPHDGMYQALIKSHKSIIYGFTATPMRMDGGKILGLTFNDLIYEIKRETLIKAGYLSPRNHMSVPDELLINVRSESLKSIPKLSRDVCGQSKGCLDHYLSMREAEQALIFVCDIRHGEEVLKILPKAKLIHSKLSYDDRKTLISDFKKGFIPFLINCEILTTGFDYPALSEIVILRPTDSFVLYEQICGRGDRIYEGKTANRIFDYTLNYYYFKKSKKTDYDKYCIYCLKITDYRLRECQYCKKALIKGEVPTRKCFQCHEKNNAKATYCIECGQFIKQNVTAIRFDKIYLSPSKNGIRHICFGTNKVKFYSRTVSAVKLIEKFSNKVAKVGDNPVDSAIAYYRFDTYHNKAALLKITLDKS